MATVDNPPSNTPFLDMYRGVEQLYSFLPDYMKHAVTLVMLNDTCPHPIKYRYTVDYDGKEKPVMETSNAKLLHEARHYDGLNRIPWKCAVCGWEYYEGKEWVEVDPKKLLLARCLWHMVSDNDDNVAHDIIAKVGKHENS